jgi:subtilisin family serine protease
MTHQRQSLMAGPAWLVLGILSSAPASSAERWLVRGGSAAAKTGAAAELDSLRLEDHGLRLLQRYRYIPWVAVEGPEAALASLRKAGSIGRYERDLPRHLLGGPTARPAAFPWLVALSFLALASCGGDDEDEPGPSGSREQTPSWGFLKIHAQEAHGQSRGRGVRVAVIDTGIDAEHPDLEVATGKNFVAAGRGPGSAEWDDCNGHGTHVAGIIAARDNSIGVLGVAPEAELYAARIFDCAGEGASISNIVAAVEWAIQQRVQVVNMSFGSSFDSQAEAEVMAAAEAAGILLVAAAGNSSFPGLPAPLDFPAAYPSVVSVSATDEADTFAEFSNQGPDQELAAPGVNVLSSVAVGTALRAGVQSGSTRYDALGMTFSGLGDVRGRLYFCGLALTSADCPSAVRGNIALVERGQNFFSEKVQNAMAAGAAAAVIYNHTETGGGLFGGTLQNPGAWIPAVGVSNASGLALKRLGDGASARVSVESDDYDFFTGTSMASPHVAGVAALLLGAQPGLTTRELRARLVAGALDLGTAGRDEQFGFGRVDAQRALGKSAASAAAAAPRRQGPGLDLAPGSL